MCCTWLAHDRARATWAYVLKTFAVQWGDRKKSWIAPFSTIIIIIIIIIFIIIIMMLAVCSLLWISLPEYIWAWVTAWLSLQSAFRLSAGQENKVGFRLLSLLARIEDRCLFCGVENVEDIFVLCWRGYGQMFYIVGNIRNRCLVFYIIWKIRYTVIVLMW